MTDGVRLARNLAGTTAIRELVTKETVPGRATEGEALARFIRSGVLGYSHPVGTCKMGHDAVAVVDDRLRVHGLKGLRVADASIMPVIVSGNTSMPCVMIGEKCADMVLEDAASG